MIYVDDLRTHAPAKEKQARRVGARNGNLWCHMFSDLPGAAGDAELIAFAGKIRMWPEWFQRHPLGNHFDLTPARRDAAIRAGAKPVDWREGVRIRRAARGAPPLYREHLPALTPKENQP